ncbi:alpha-L-rhamnosidase [Pseudonocardia kunmingensis]|uniref:alpha-L-rhamnosidase n=1 Tax=Pseudonocardia kunmingensis TaxID=630975 RepID=A0A543E0B5_9PSEU|nr:alpha-L-rhamnosidase [Pseudonocardia kunmingensis]TQM15025.1 alpha-L-rhamnosidase [Pseudonocardia kunmingensis]
MVEVSRRAVLGGLAGVAALAALPVAVRGSATAPPPLQPVALTTEHLAHPLGIDAAAPRFGWQLEAQGTDRAQSAYRILVASRPELLPDAPDVWDSGVVASAEQSAQVYGGPPLASRTRYHWTVRTWDERGREGPAAGTAWFETAMPDPQDWTAAWIGSGLVVPKAVRVLGPQLVEPAPLAPGATLGQSLVSDGPVAAVAVLLGVPAGETAACVLSVRRDGPDGELFGRTVLEGLTGDEYGNAAGRLDLAPPAAPGPLYVELADARGPVSWMSSAEDSYAGGSAHVDGAAVPGDRWVHTIPPDPPADPLLRHEFDLPAPVASARLYLVGLGCAVAEVNGQRVGDAALAPAPTDYDRRCLYGTHDVGGLLRAGRNAIGVALGRGFYATRSPDTDGSDLARWVGEPRLRAQLEIDLVDGRHVTVGSGPDWRLTEGPTTYDGVFTGESYDAGRAARVAGWSAPGFDDGGWRPASVVDGPGGALVAYAGEPVRAGAPIEPVAVTTPAPGVRVLDFGVVLAGWARLRGSLPAGTTVRLQYGEKLGPSGRVEVGIPGGFENGSVTGRFQRDEYTAAGGREETWQPSFAFKGFQYVEVTGTDAPLEVQAVPVGSDLAETMQLRIEHPELQWIADAFRRTARNSLHGVPDQAPGKLSWTTATYRAVAPMLYQFGMASVFASWLDDIRLAQAPDGEIPLIAPLGATAGGMLLTPSSTGVYPFLVHRYWLTYGDPTVPRRHFDAVRRYLGWLSGMLRDDLADDRFGDWYPPRPVGGPMAPEGGTLVGTAHVIASLRDGAALADVVGEPGQAAAWRDRADAVTRRFTAAFLDAGTGTYRTPIDAGYRQTSNAVPLAAGIVPPEHVGPVVANLVADVEAQERHLDTGALGTGALPYALSDNGRADLAVAVLGQTAYPSYGHLRALGATTFWESWEDTARGHNDTTLSEPVRWLVERAAGIEPLEPGWARFRVQPRVTAALPGARITLHTVRGRIDLAWRRADRLELDLRVPVNAVAQVVLPDGRQRELGSGEHRIEG